MVVTMVPVMEVERELAQAVATVAVLPVVEAVVEAVALLLRDVMSVIGFFVARAVTWLRAVTFRARPLGKVVTGLQLATLFALIVWPAGVGPLVAAVGVVAVAATVDYTLLLWRERARG